MTETKNNELCLCHVKHGSGGYWTKASDKILYLAEDRTWIITPNQSKSTIKKVGSKVSHKPVMWGVIGGILSEKITVDSYSVQDTNRLLEIHSYENGKIQYVEFEDQTYAPK
jgi:hypothetical protein